MNDSDKTKIKFLDDSDRPKISKLAILSLVLGIFSLLFFVLAGIPAIVVGIFSIIIIRSSSGEIRGKYFAWAGIGVSIVFMCIFCWLWSLDAPPIPNDYTIEDLRSAPEQYAESFEILKTLLGEDDDSSNISAIEITDSDGDMIAEVKKILETGTKSEISKTLSYHAEKIEQIWVDNGTAREIIHRLNEFTEIADLTDLNDNLKLKRLSKLIDLARLNQAYVHLKIEQNDVQSFVTELIELDSICRKLSVYARALFTKLIYLVCIDENIVTANTIVNDLQTPMSTVELMAEHFTPLTDEQTSMHNSILSQYLYTKSMLPEISEQIAAEKTLPLKKNSTLRLLRNFCDYRMDAEEGKQHAVRTKLSVWPDIYPFKEPSISSENWEWLPLLYTLYNPQISVFDNFGPSRNPRKSMEEHIDQLKIQDDLLQIVIDQRLGMKTGLKARAYSDEYIIDIEREKIFSPGPDGKVDTKDDIFLRINPEVLGW